MPLGSRIKRSLFSFGRRVRKAFTRKKSEKKPVAEAAVESPTLSLNGSVSHLRKQVSFNDPECDYYYYSPTPSTSRAYTNSDCSSQYPNSTDDGDDIHYQHSYLSEVDYLQDGYPQDRHATEDGYPEEFNSARNGYVRTEDSLSINSHSSTEKYPQDLYSTGEGYPQDYTEDNNPQKRTEDGYPHKFNSTEDGYPQDLNSTEDGYPQDLNSAEDGYPQGLLSTEDDAYSQDLPLEERAATPLPHGDIKEGSEGDTKYDSHVKPRSPKKRWLRVFTKRSRKEIEEQHCRALALHDLARKKSLEAREMVLQSKQVMIIDEQTCVINDDFDS